MRLTGSTLQLKQIILVLTISQHIWKTSLHLQAQESLRGQLLSRIPKPSLRNHGGQADLKSPFSVETTVVVSLTITFAPKKYQNGIEPHFSYLVGCFELHPPKLDRPFQA